MVTRGQRAQLPDPKQLNELFTVEVISHLAQIADIPDVAIPRFKNDIRRAVESYLQDAQRLDAGQVQDAIENLLRESEAALEGRPGAVVKLVQTLANLPKQARDYLENLAAAAGDTFPSPSNLRDLNQRREALCSISGLCGRAAHVVPGRHRPGGKQSRPTIKKTVSGPRVRRGRPSNVEELVLCAAVGQAYLETTGKHPARWRRNQDRGPFVQLMGEIFNILGVAISADGLVRAYLDLSNN